MLKQRSAGFVDRPEIFLWLAAAVGALLLIPLVATALSDDMKWDAFDFVIAGALLFLSGTLLVLAMRTFRTTTSRLIAGGVVLAFFAYVFVELAVGVFTDLGS